MPLDDPALELAFEFQKVSPDGRFVRGWASVATVDGEPLADWEGDTVDIAELREGAHRFILEQRVAKAMHKGEAIGEVVESVIVDDEFVAAIGAATPLRGWWIGMEVHSAEIRKRVVDRKLRGFSIGGGGVRRKLKA